MGCLPQNLWRPVAASERAVRPLPAMNAMARTNDINVGFALSPRGQTRFRPEDDRREVRRKLDVLSRHNRMVFQRSEEAVTECQAWKCNNVWTGRRRGAR